jgi:hypothetical protein
MPGEDERSIEELHRVIATAPPGSLVRHAAYHSIGRALWHTYQSDQKPETLEQAIDALNKAVEESPEGGWRAAGLPERPGHRAQ